MKPDTDLLRRLEALILKAQNFVQETKDDKQKQSAENALTCIGRLADSVLQQEKVFGVEPWHPVDAEVPLVRPGEMLLRVKDPAGAVMPPYPVIMSFYQSGMTAEIDTVLFLIALTQFRAMDESQVSINISAQSLKDSHFIKSSLAKIETLNLEEDEKIIIEIHESTADSAMSQKVLTLFRKFGIGFAIDDVGLSMNDVFRLSAFESMADFIKIDRHSVCAHPDDPHSLGQVLSLATSLLPQAAVVAEGVRTAEHAYEIRARYPQVKYVQGLYLPDRGAFTGAWKDVLASHPPLPAAVEKKSEQSIILKS